MRQMCIHDLRRTYSTLLLRAGARIIYVSPQPGHRDASITLRVYAHWLMCRAASICSTRYNRTQPPRNEGGSDDESIERKSCVLNGDPVLTSWNQMASWLSQLQGLQSRIVKRAGVYESLPAEWGLGIRCGRAGC